MAKRISANGDALGIRIKSGVDIPGNGEPWLTTVGVVGDVKDRLTSHSSRLLVCFAVVALLLAALGIGGLLAYNAAQRVHEFGVRIAVGANRRDLLVLVFQHCLQLSGMGILAGFAASIALTRTLSALLYDTSALDPGTFA